MSSSTARDYGIGTLPIGNARAFTWIADILLLTKARVNSLVVGTTFFGFALHAEILSNWLLLLQTLLGTGFVACGAAAANQVLEHEYDRKMSRTRNRPVAAGRMSRHAAGWLSGTLCITGCTWLWIAVNLRTMLLAGLAFLIYACIYTPLKRHSPACTVMGAVSGALPFAVGWAATRADFGVWTLLGLGILFLWQIPHVLAIAWWRRKQYVQAGFHMLSRKDVQGKVLAGWVLSSTIAVLSISLVPAWIHDVSAWYLPGSVALGITFLAFSLRLVISKSESAARTLFMASLYYLPGVYLLMLISQ